MTRRAILHVGTPKSGTSYLQDRLAANRERLRGEGIAYVETRAGDHFEAALDLLGDSWDGAIDRARGQWEALVERTRGEREDVLVSHEILAGADADAVARVRAAFPDDELHLVLTVRDLGRQVPAEWQENVKHRAPRPFASYLKRLESGLADPREDRFWRVQHLPTIVATWAADLPPERLHLVTVPPAGSPPHALWERYAAALGLRASSGWAPASASNASLGAAETTLLRHLNVALIERGLPRDSYVRWVRDGLVRQVLAAGDGSAPATVPPRLRPWLTDLAADWVEQLRGSGARVHGDLADLAPVWPPDEEAWEDPDHPDTDVVTARAVAALAWTIESAARVAPPPTDQPPGHLARLRRAVRTWRHA